MPPKLTIPDELTFYGFLKGNTLDWNYKNTLLDLANTTDSVIGFKVQMTAPKHYAVVNTCGIIRSLETLQIQILPKKIPDETDSLRILCVPLSQEVEKNVLLQMFKEESENITKKIVKFKIKIVLEKSEEDKGLLWEQERGDLMLELTKLRSENETLKKNSLSAKLEQLTIDELEELDEKCDSLRSKIKQKLKEIRACPICFDKNGNMVFNCGHKACSTCSKELKNCPICRQTITAKIKTF